MRPSLSRRSVLSLVLACAIAAVGLLIVIYFFVRVAYQIRNARPELYFKPHI